MAEKKVYRSFNIMYDWFNLLPINMSLSCVFRNNTRQLQYLCLVVSNMHQIYWWEIKSRVHCFSIQVGKNKCFLLNPEKKFWRRPVLSFSNKRKNAHFNSEKRRHQIPAHWWSGWSSASQSEDLEPGFISHVESKN